jgi:hypothetical protein
MLADPRSLQVQLDRVGQESHARLIVEHVGPNVDRDVLEVLSDLRIRNERFGLPRIGDGVDGFGACSWVRLICSPVQIMIALSLRCSVQGP